MIVSKSKQEDIRFRLFFLSELKNALANRLPITAKFCGEQSKRLADKIKNHDYSKDETFDEIWQRKVNEGCERNGLPKIY